MLSLALLSIGGCAARSVLTKGFMTAELVQQTVRANHDRVRSMKGTGRITIETPEIAQSGSFELALQKPDSVLMKLEGPFGIDVGSALLTRKEFLFYNIYQNEVITGTTSAENLTKILRIQLSFDDLLALFSGGTFFGDDQTMPDAVTVQEDQYVFTYRHPYGERRYWVDPATQLIARIQQFDGQDKLRFDQAFSNFRNVGGATVPFRIRIREYQTGRALSIAYTHISVNTGSLQFTFTIPESAARVRWQ